MVLQLRRYRLLQRLLLSQFSCLPWNSMDEEHVLKLNEVWAVWLHLVCVPAGQEIVFASVRKEIMKWYLFDSHPFTILSSAHAYYSLVIRVNSLLLGLKIVCSWLSNTSIGDSLSKYRLDASLNVVPQEVSCSPLFWACCVLRLRRCRFCVGVAAVEGLI